MRLSPGQENRLSDEPNLVIRAMNKRRASERAFERSLPTLHPGWYKPYWRYMVPFYIAGIVLSVLGLGIIAIQMQLTDETSIFPGALFVGMGLLVLIGSVLLDQRNSKDNPTGQGDYVAEDNESDPFDFD